MSSYVLTLYPMAYQILWLLPKGWFKKNLINFGLMDLLTSYEYAITILQTFHLFMQIMEMALTQFIVNF